MSGGPARLLAWDGLSLSAPAAWEPARLGRGYLLLEDAVGPRLELRWQRVAPGFAPDKALKRLARKKQLGQGSAHGLAVRSVLAALPGESKARACAPSAKGGQGGDALLFVLPGGATAVLAALHPRPEDAPAPDWPAILLSLVDSAPEALSLYDIAARVPPGFRLAEFSFALGHYHIRYRKGGDSLDFSRFAPAQAILRDKTLAAWAGEVFAPTLGAKRTWTAGDLDGMEAVASGGFRPLGPAGTVRAVASRLYAPARWRPAMAWRADASKILAVTASHCGGLEPQTFEEICRNYVVVQTP